MFKKITCIFLCLIFLFLLSISCVVADENISDYPSLHDNYTTKKGSWKNCY